MLKAVIFDMDGVMIDSEPVHMEGNRMLMEHLGLEFNPEYYGQFIGSTTGYMWNKMIHDFSLRQSPDELMALSDKFVSKILGEKGYPQNPGVGELIVRMKQAGYKLAIASSSGMKRIEYVLSCMGLTEYMDGIVSGMLVEHPKPAPDTFLKAAEILQVQPDECIVVEDSVNGMKAAKAAGMVCIGYENPSTMQKFSQFFGREMTADMSYADYVVQGFEEMDAGDMEMIYCHAMHEP